MYKFLPIVLLVFVVWACDLAAKKNKKLNFGYPDVPSMMNAQAIFLKNSQAGLQKTTYLNKQKEETTVLPNYLNWEDELHFFKEIELNRPSYIGFITTDSVQTESGLLVRYKSTKKEIPVKMLSMEYNKNKVLKHLDCTISKENELAKIDKVISADFDTAGAASKLIRYQLQSTQKIIWLQPTFSKAECVVLTSR